MRVCHRYQAGGMGRTAVAAAVSLLMWSGAWAAASLKDSWNYYQGQLERGASAQQLENTLTRILSNPEFANLDLSAIENELKRVRTEVAFKESIEYYNSRVEAGIPREDQAVLLERIIKKYEARGMDMSELRLKLMALLPEPEKPAPPPPRVAPSPPPKPAPPKRNYEWTVSFLGGAHFFPNGSYFINNPYIEAKDLNSIAGFVDIRQRFDAVSWGLEAGGYGATIVDHDFSLTPAAVFRTRLETTVIRLTPLVHVGTRESLFDLALGVGGGAYMWRKEETASLDTTPEITGTAASAGTIFAGHGTVRVLVQFAESHAFVLDYSYALAKEDDPEKINASGDAINFGGHTALAGLALRF